ncbi:MAG: T9SS type A sorting domain-containing protein, partial [Chlorobi bacterium]|nr:T9SS type A sorting domain-containing protein [Chlorobiota bacterium]
WLAEIDYWITEFARVRPCLVLGHILEYFDLDKSEFAFKCGTPVVDDFDETACELSPNPSNGNFNIIIPDNAHGLSTISVVDIYGKEIYNSSLIGIQAGMSVNIELPSATVSGVYFVRLTGTGGVITKKIVVRD